jgi:hypothetical protein
MRSLNTDRTARGWLATSSKSVHSCQSRADRCQTEFAAEIRACLSTAKRRKRCRRRLIASA